MKRGFIWLLLAVTLTSFVSADDISVWQGQYFTGTTFNTGSYEVNFSVYDARIDGNICYTNTTEITMGNFGEWKTEQIGVNAACNDAYKDYFLEIKITNETQGERRRLMMMNYLPTDGGKIKGDLIIAGEVKGENEDLNIFSSIQTVLNKNGFVRHLLKNTNSSPDTVTIYSLENDLGHQFSMALTSSTFNETGLNRNNRGVMSLNSPGAMEFLIRYRQPFVWNINPNNDGNLLPQTEIMKLEPEGNLSVIGNMSANSGFFSFLGDATTKITKLFVQDINLSGNLTGMTKEIFFQADPTDTNFGDFRTRSVASGAIWRFNFQVPSDFSSLTSLEIVLIPVGTNAAAPVDLSSDCGGIGEAYNLHSESLSTNWNLTTNNIHAIDISGVFTNLNAGDFCGLQIDEGAFGSATHYLGIRLKYKT